MMWDDGGLTTAQDYASRVIFYRASVLSRFSLTWK